MLIDVRVLFLLGSRKLFLKTYGYRMEGKVRFIFKSLSPVNHGRMGLD